MKEQFLNRLTVLAKICNHKLDEWQFDLYDSELRSRGYKSLCDAIDKIIISRKSNSPFPSVSEIKELIPNANTTVEPNYGSCGSCDSGILMAERIDMNAAPYAFLCDCEAGSRNPRRFPKWTDEQFNQFRPLWGKKRNQVILINANERKEENERERADREFEGCFT